MEEDKTPSAPELPGAEKTKTVDQIPLRQPNYSPKPQREEEVLRDATANLDDEVVDQAPIHNAVVGMQPKKSHKKLVIILFLIVVISIVAAWYFLVFTKDKTNNSNNNNNTTTNVAPVNAFMPESVAYAFKAADKDPYSIFTRPAVGGDRKEVQKLESSKNILRSNTFGQIVSYISDNIVYDSTDGGKTYNKIYEKTGAEEIIDVAVSRDSKRIAISILPNYGTDSKGKAISVDLLGKDKQTLVESEKAIYIHGFNNTKQKLVYGEGCYACDGPQTAYKVYDIKTKTSKDIIKDLNTATVNYYKAVSDDLTKFIYSEGIIDPVVKPDGLGDTSVAPYKVNIVNLDTLEIVVGATVGTKGEKNANGTQKYRTIKPDFLAGTNIPYFVDGKEIQKITDGKVSLLYQADKPILAAHFVSDKNVIVSTGDDTADFLLSNYSLADKKSTQIFSGDNNTLIFGVTTK